MSKAEAQRRDLFLASVLVAELLLVSCSWPLWAATSEFPVTPLVSALSAVPIVVDQYVAILYIVTLAICLGLCLANAPSAHTLKCCCGLALVPAVMLPLLNQQRFQPWHWLTILVFVQQFFAEKDRRWLNQLTVASIYIFAGVSRLGPDTATGVSRQMALMFFQTIGANNVVHNEAALYAVCVAMTLAEFLTGVFLLLSKTRKAGIAAAIVLHLGLLCALGPWGLNHHAGVLVWNAFFIAAVPLLFRSALAGPNDANAAMQQNRQSRAALVFAVVTFLWPASALVGVADNWLGWQVYSPRADVLRLYVEASAVDRIPASLQPYVEPPQPLEDWCPVRVDRWSLEALGAPLYPEDRLQLAVALNVCQSLPDDKTRVLLQQARHPWWQGATRTEVTGVHQIRSQSAGFWLNAEKSRP